MKEWDFDRFFNNLNMNATKKESPEATQTKDKIQAKEKPKPRKHTRNGSVDLPPNALRRENSDFSMLLPRHSANLADHIRSSNATLNKLATSQSASSMPSANETARASPREDTRANASSRDDTRTNPTPPEGVRRSAASQLFSSFSSKINGAGWKPSRPRRERTDGDIVLKPRPNVWELRKTEVEMRNQDTLGSRCNTLTARNRNSFIYDDQSQVSNVARGR